MSTASRSKSDRLVIKVESYEGGGVRRHLFTRTVPASSLRSLTKVIAAARADDVRLDAVRLRAAG